MKQNPFIERITIYPVKSLDGVLLQQAQVGNGSCLQHDREYAIKTPDGKFVNGKKNAMVHLLRMKIDLENEIISFRHQNETGWQEFDLQKDNAAADGYLSSFFKMPVQLYKNSEGRFLDIPDISGVTVLSNASLQTVSGWFNVMNIEETRERFRATLEIAAVPAFWEDHLFFDEETAIEFTIGDVRVYGMSPRARCIVPTRHPQTGGIIYGFQKSFADHRKESLPAWSTLLNYNHGYHLSVDCHIPSSETGKWIKTGDEITIVGKTKLHQYHTF